MYKEGQPVWFIGTVQGAVDMCVGEPEKHIYGMKGRVMGVDGNSVSANFGFGTWYYYFNLVSPVDPTSQSIAQDYHDYYQAITETDR